MSIDLLKTILKESNNIVCLLGRAPASEQGCDFYRDDFIFDIEDRYGCAPEEIWTGPYVQNRPAAFYSFYRDEVLKKRGEPDEVNFFLKRLEDERKLSGIVTRGFFGLSSRAGCRNVIPLYGTIDENYCPHCGTIYPASYIMEHQPIPYCEKCQTMIHPGVRMVGEMLDPVRMTKAIELISSADVLLVIGCTLQSSLGALAKYFSGEKVCLINKTEHYSDSAADCVVIGEFSEIIRELQI